MAWLDTSDIIKKIIFILVSIFLFDFGDDSLSPELSYKKVQSEICYRRGNASRCWQTVDQTGPYHTTEFRSRFEAPIDLPGKDSNPRGRLEEHSCRLRERKLAFVAKRFP